MDKKLVCIEGHQIFKPFWFHQKKFLISALFPLNEHSLTHFFNSLNLIILTIIFFKHLMILVIFVYLDCVLFKIELLFKNKWISWPGYNIPDMNYPCICRASSRHTAREGEKRTTPTFLNTYTLREGEERTTPTFLNTYTLREGEERTTPVREEILVSAVSTL